MKKIELRKEIWSVLPLMIFMMAGTWVSVHDFVVLHQKVFQTPAREGGALLMLFGMGLGLAVRFTLIERAGFSSLAQTKRLLITDEHILITDGVFRHIRHPLYLGIILLNFGIALFFSSMEENHKQALLEYLNRKPS